MKINEIFNILKNNLEPYDGKGIWTTYIATQEDLELIAEKIHVLIKEEERNKMLNIIEMIRNNEKRLNEN